MLTASYNNRAPTTGHHGAEGAEWNLGGEDVARAPSDLSTQTGEGLNEHTGLDGHVQATGDTGTSQRLGCSVSSPEEKRTNDRLWSE